MDKGLYAAPQGLAEMDNAAPDIEIEIEDPESVQMRMDGIEIDIEPEDKDEDFSENIAEHLDEEVLATLE